MNCPCCSTPATAFYPALTAGWISEYLYDQPPVLTELAHCHGCQCHFFVKRYSEAECARLYADYRGPAYFAVRHKHEPWYTRHVNDSFATDQNEVDRRRERLKAIILDQVGRADSILDWGGDRGQFIPDVTQRKFCFDVSGVECVPGVVGISHKPDLLTYDCVLVCHVLEHMADPLATLQEIAQHVSPRGSVVIALPREHFSLSLVPRGRWYRAYLNIIRRTPIHKLIDFYSTAAKIKLHCIPPGGFIKQSEHLTIFSPTSIQSLVHRAGFTVTDPIQLDRNAIFGEEYLCVAKRPAVC